MRLRYTATALVEIDEIFAYISERNPSAAERVVARIELIIQNLGHIPEMAQEADEPGVRRMPVTGYPFLVFYTIEADEVVILHVWHGARRPPWQHDDED